MKKDNSSAYLLLTFMIIVACFVVSWKLIIPKYQANLQQRDQLDIDIKNSSNKLDSLKTTQSSLNKLGDLVNKMLVAVPNDKDSANLITELEAIANTYTVTIPSIQITDKGSESNTITGSTGETPVSRNQVAISFSAYGSYLNLVSFIGSIEKDIRFMNIDSYSLTSSSDQKGESDEIMTLSIQITAYKHVNTSLSQTTNSTLPNQTLE